jgi:hypothetical protein
MHRLRRHLSYANVAATLALVVAIAGGTTAIAGNKIGAQDIKKIKVRQAVAPGTGSGAPPFALARCRPGEKLTGGGGAGFGSESYPQGNGWAAKGLTGTGGVVAYALCLAR